MNNEIPEHNPNEAELMKEAIKKLTQIRKQYQSGNEDKEEDDDEDFEEEEDYYEDIPELPVVENNKFKSWYEFDVDIYEAVCYFMEKYGYLPDLIAFNKHTYSQICYILSVSPKRSLYSGGKEKKGVDFNYIEIVYEPDKDYTSYQSVKTWCHFDEFDYQSPYAAKINDQDLTETDELNYKPIDGEIVRINNPSPKKYLKYEYETQGPDLIQCMIDEELPDMEFDLILVDENDEDDDEDDFDDDIPDLPKGDLVKEKELIV